MDDRVKLISVTPNAEDTILYCARVSSDQENTDPGLLRYLIRNNHWSPFEMAHMVVEINTSRAIAQQILRHRSFSFQEFSQRYASPESYCLYEPRRQAEKNRQSSVDDLPEEIKAWWRKTQRELGDAAFDAYRFAVENGVAKECARFLLPVSATTKLYMAGSVRSWIHYFNLRCDEHTQLEHRIIATEILDIFVGQFSVISDAIGIPQCDARIGHETSLKCMRRKGHDGKHRGANAVSWNFS